MLKVDKNIIYLTKGDSAYFEVEVEKQGKSYEIQDTDTVTMTVRKYLNTDVVFSQSFMGAGNFYLAPADTADLSVGRYKFDVEITTELGDKFTVIVGDLFLTQEVTI